MYLFFFYKQKGVKFGDTTLQGVHFSRADLRGAQLDWASAREKHVFTHAKGQQPHNPHNHPTTLNMAADLSTFLYL
jgi:hypothetical protein